MRYQRIVIIGTSLLMVFLHSFFQTPNHDEGLNAYFITNTIDFEPPFFITTIGWFIKKLVKFMKIILINLLSPL